jgi:phosphoglycerol transferase MdoB-like AlkP superfamily enzyme
MPLSKWEGESFALAGKRSTLAKFDGTCMHLFLLALFIYWLLLFAALRAFFLSYNFRLLLPSDHRAFDIVHCFWQSLSLDASMAAYFLVIPWLVLALSGSRFRGRSQAFLKTYVAIITVAYCWIAVSESFIYPEWKQKLNARILTTLAHPTEIVRSVPWTDLIIGLLVWLMLSFGAFQVFRNGVSIFLHQTGRHRLRTMLLIVSWPIILGVTARGGTKAIAIDVSRVYFSNDPILNDAAVNPANYFLRNIMQSNSYKFGTNIFASMPMDEAVRVRDELVRKPKNPGLKIVKDGTPNLVFIILESWSADLVASLGGRSEIAPQFAQLEKNGILFTDFYSNGNRSQQGIASIFGAFPALPRSTITEDPGKARKLPGLARKLSQVGYSSTFLYGGQLEYGNIKSFLVDSGFQTIIEDKDLDSALPRANLGVIDGEMFKILHQSLNKQTAPFFTAFFNLNSHAPYDIPNKDRYHFEGIESEYVKSAMYVDEELGRFFSDIKHEPWFANTLFVIVADHSHNTYRNRSTHDPGYRRIPFLLYGGAIKEEYRGTTWNRVGSQVDIVATILAQLGMEHTEFEWSKDMFHPNSPEFAYYEVGNGVGWVTREGALVYEFDEKELRQSSLPAHEEVTATKNALAYLQVLFQSFIDL